MNDGHPTRRQLVEMLWEQQRPGYEADFDATCERLADCVTKSDAEEELRGFLERDLARFVAGIEMIRLDRLVEE